jgi:glucan phosphoethanolaminetransferase (alkaline phosphatase superfamily)
MSRVENVAARKSSNGIVHILVLTQFVFPFLSVASLQVMFRSFYHVRIIYYHMLIVGTVNGVVLLGALVISAGHPTRIRILSKYLLSLILGCFSVFLYWIHILAWGGNLTTANYISAPMLIPFVKHLGSTIGVLPAPALAVWGVLIVIPLAILIFYVVLSSRLFAFLGRLSAFFRENKWRLIVKLKRPRWIGIAAGLILMAGYADHRYPLGKALTSQEPITSILFNADDLTPLVRISRLGFEDDEVRRSYVCPAHFEKKNVILIVVDALRPDHLGFTGYPRNTSPFLDSLYRNGNLRFVHSSLAAAPWSFGGILSILRAKHLFNMGYRNFAIHDLLRDVGYRIHFVLSADHTYFCRLKAFYGENIDSFFDGNSPRSFGPNDDRDIFENLSRIEDFEGVPSFFYFHLMSVHSFGPRLPQNVRFTPASVSPTNAESYVNNYDNGVIQADHNIQSLFERLKQKGYLQNSIVVITADHGESLGERNSFGHGHNLYKEELSIPIMIYDPEKPAYKNLTIGRQIDIAPTILDLLGLPAPSSWDGRSLLTAEPAQYSYHQLGDSYAVVDYTTSRTLEYLYDARSKKEEVYDLTKDPDETCNLFSTMSAHEIGALRKAIGAFSITPAVGEQNSTNIKMAKAP